MAVLVQVNGLDAYALLNTGSMTMLITHDFAQVAKLSVFQLENPVVLQLGTVRSHSIINFRMQTQVQLRPINEDDTYLDIINIDQYDMIIGTPFMHKHGFTLDFGQNTISAHGQKILPMSSGKEDLMLEKRQASQPRLPRGPTVSTSH